MMPAYIEAAEERDNYFSRWSENIPKEGSNKLGLDHFAGLDTACAHTDPLVCRVYLCLHRLKIDVPAAPGNIVRMRDVVAELGLFAADFTYLCHKLVS